jgi:glycosyltransferase involved in cell wall biosynthesis
MKTISVVIPSRLAKMPSYMGGFHWLDRALVSIRAQTVYQEFKWQIVIGVDKNFSQKVPFHVLEGDDLSTVIFAESQSSNQAAAVNAAAERATGDFLAILEDDDFWHSQKIGSQLLLLEIFDLVTTSQRVIDPAGNIIGVSEFPTPSTWLMRRKSWDDVGGFDQKFPRHVDTEWLGRATQKGFGRIHIVHVGVVQDHLKSLKEVSEIVSLGHSTPLVDRTDNPQGGFSRILKDPEFKAQSVREYEIMLERFGRAPW